MITVSQTYSRQGDRQCEGCSLHSTCLTRGLSKADLEAFDDIMVQPQPLKRGQELVRQGQSFHSLYLVRAGSLKKVMRLPGRHDEQVIRFYLPSETVGLEAIGEAYYPASVVALETTFICELPFEQLVSFAEQYNALRTELMRCMSRELRGDQRQVCLLSGRSTAEQRLASFLLGLSRRLHARGYSRYRFQLTMSRADIGSHLGLALETVSRVMGRFQRQGLVRVSGRELTIRSLESLEALGEEGSGLIGSPDDRRMIACR
ncbi:helix-turn-helix domain-containing protein [Halomonas sp.]|uniref:helix-turn-helix domain-containing protein n=1 Tax=Halomonas sp. TaxID=1486246 RepID=UPI00384E041F